MSRAQEELEKCCRSKGPVPPWVGAIDEQIAQQPGLQVKTWGLKRSEVIQMLRFRIFFGLNLCEELRTLAEGQSGTATGTASCTGLRAAQRELGAADCVETWDGWADESRPFASRAVLRAISSARAPYAIEFHTQKRAQAAAEVQNVYPGVVKVYLRALLNPTSTYQAIPDNPKKSESSPARGQPTPTVEGVEDPQAYRTDRFHSAMLTAVEFFEFVLLLLALCQLQGVPWDYLLNELVFLRQLTPLLAKLLELLVAASPERQKEDTSAEQLRRSMAVVQELLGEAERLTGRTAEQLQRSLKADVERGERGGARAPDVTGNRVGGETGGGAPLPEQLRAVPQFRAEHGLPSDRRTSNEKGRLKVKACDVVSAGGFMGRFLCFHGKGSSGALLRERLSPLAREVDLVCVDAPHRLGDGYAWWHLPPGERSFTTPVFDGWAETVEYVRKVWAEQGPFDGMLGFSQGAILIAALVALGELRPGQPLASCRRLVLCGAALPGPFRSELADLRAKPCHGISALHTIGRQDDINPPEQAREVAAAVGGEIFEFEGTHEVPMDEAAMSAYRRLLGA
ncbi:Esterase OVCA2 (Ovarian cancer-associated gene 2 protein homolog) [Durusdinium trenchii]|uniref:Esterase OVCA2 (Ovarian cancer-associated gene 2 protein homolog) n=1 Tax=Durusdinium trenchii TaxID=1381693 RepID=A0ABP0P9S1_9DINO